MGRVPVCLAKMARAALESYADRHRARFAGRVWRLSPNSRPSRRREIDGRGRISSDKRIVDERDWERSRHMDRDASQLRNPRRPE